MPNPTPKTREENLDDAAKQNKLNKLLGPGFFFLPLKTTLSVVAYREAEVFSTEQLIQYIQDWSTKSKERIIVAIQGKYDGVSCSLHRDKNGNFYVFTEDGTEVSAKFPHIIKIAEAIFPETDYIIIGEVEKWIRKESTFTHAGREVVSGELHTKGTETFDQNYVFNLHDCIWFEGEDLHEKIYSERWPLVEDKFHVKQSLLDNLQPGSFNLVPTVVCSTDDQIRKVCQRLAQFGSLEGAMIKKWDGYQFELDGRTADMIKYKKYAEAHCIVVDSRLIKGQESTWQYKIGIEVLPSELPEVDESVLVDLPRPAVRKGRGRPPKPNPDDALKVMVVGKTFNTGVKAQPGDVITVKFHTLFLERNEDGKFKLTLYEPNVYENRSIANPDETPDTVSTLLKVGKDSQLLRMKDLDDVIPFELVKQMNIMEQYPEETAVHKYVMHHHWRGKSVHCDFRLQHIKNQYLIGYTLDIALPGVVEEPVLTMDGAKAWAANDKLWKFNVQDGTFKARQTRGGLKKATSIVTQLKEVEPLEWLTFEGIVEPGGVGSTREYPGVFYIANKGFAEYGYRTGYFHEYWVHSDHWENGGQRLIFRQLATDFGASTPISKFLQWAFDLDNPVENFIIEESEITCKHGSVVLPNFVILDFNKAISFEQPLAPAEAPPIRTPSFWMMIKPNDDEAYILSRRAVNKERMAPYGISALPKGIRDQVPDEYKYWKIKSSDKAMKMRNDLVTAIKKKEVTIDWEQAFEKVPLEEAKGDVVRRDFVVNRRTWRGPIHVRVGFSAELYDLWIDMDDFVYLFTFNNDPTSSNSTTGTLEKIKEPRLMEVLGEVPAGSELNPNKRIPVRIDRIADGNLLLLIDDPDLKKFQVRDDDWKGLYIIEQDENTNIWTLRATGNVGQKE